MQLFCDVRRPHSNGLGNVQRGMECSIVLCCADEAGCAVCFRLLGMQRKQAEPLQVMSAAARLTDVFCVAPGLHAAAAFAL